MPPLVKQIAQRINAGINAAITATQGALRLVFSGSEYVTHTAWTPTGVNFTIGCTYTPGGSDIGSEVDVLNDGTVGLYKDSSDNLVFSYVDTGATLRTITLSAVTLVAGQAYSPVISSDGTGVTLTLNGQSASNSAVVDPAEIAIDTWMADQGAASNFSDGSISSVVFDDLSPIQGTRAVFANGTDNYVGFSDVTLTDYTVTAWVVFNGFNGVRVMGNTGNFFSRLVINSNGSINFRPSASSTSIDAAAGTIKAGHNMIQAIKSGTSATIKLNGATVQSGTVDAAAMVINCIFRNSSSFLKGTIRLHVQDDSTGDTWEWLLDNYTDNLDGTGGCPNTGNTGASYDGTVFNWNETDDTVIYAANDSVYSVGEGQGSTLADSGSRGEDATIQNFSGTMWQ